MAGGDAAARSGVSKKKSIECLDEGRGDLLPESFYKLSHEKRAKVGLFRGFVGDAK